MNSKRETALEAAARLALKALDADCELGGDYHDTAVGRFTIIPKNDCPACALRSALETK